MIPTRGTTTFNKQQKGYISARITKMLLKKVLLSLFLFSRNVLSDLCQIVECKIEDD